jgi:hypothetical protein
MKDIEGQTAQNNLIDALNSTTVGDRYANLVKYQSPSIQGVRVAYAYSDSAVGGSGSDHTTTSSNTSAALDGTKLRSFNVQYTFQGINFAYANASTGAASVAGAAGVEQSTTRFSVQGTVMGATVGASRTSNELNTAGTDTRDQTTVSARVPFGQGFAAFASYTDNDSTTATTNGKSYSLMLTKDLSKRTTVYAGYSDADYDGASADVKVTAAGLVHRF